MIISVYNEAPRLSSKLRNILSADGADRIKDVLIGSDGSTDQPANVIQEFNDTRIKLFPFHARRGKPSILNELIPRATGDILLMLDVRQRLDQYAIPALLDCFSDPGIGVVSGELVFECGTSDTSAAKSIDAYWRYEKWIRDGESRFRSVPGATGALYAIRRELAKPIPAESALDDVLIPMQAVAAGYRCVLEPSAKIYDLPAQDARQEAIRKRRTLAGCVQLLRLHPAWCLPGGHPIWWQFFSHKIARLFSPFFLAGSLLFLIPLITGPIPYRILLAGQILFYMLGAWGVYQKKLADHASYAGGLRSLARMIGVFLSMQAALLVGWKDGLSRSNLAVWKKVKVE